MINFEKYEFFKKIKNTFKDLFNLSHILNSTQTVKAFSLA